MVSMGECKFIPDLGVRKVRLITPEEHDEFLKKNLCFVCSQTWSRGHYCPQRQWMHMVYEDIYDNSNEDSNGSGVKNYLLDEMDKLCEYEDVILPEEEAAHAHEIEENLQEITVPNSSNFGVGLGASTNNLSYVEKEDIFSAMEELVTHLDEEEPPIFPIQNFAEDFVTKEHCGNDFLAALVNARQDIEDWNVSKDEVNEVYIQEMNLILVNVEQIPWVFNNLPAWVSEEGILIFAYEKITVEEIERKLIQIGFEVNDFQGAVSKKFTGKVTVMTRLMHLTINIFMRASDFSLEGAIFKENRRSNISISTQFNGIIHKSSGHMQLNILYSRKEAPFPTLGVNIESYMENDLNINFYNSGNDYEREHVDKGVSNPRRHKFFGRITYIIWGWYYKEFRFYFRRIEDFIIVSSQNSQSYLHPGMWNREWLIAWATHC